MTKKSENNSPNNTEEAHIPFDGKKMLRDMTFVVFDLETTGGNQKNDKIIEIGLVKIENLEIVQEVSYLINPEIKIPDFIQKLTGIKQDDVQDSQLIEDVIDDVLEMMGDSILVAHNTSFDIPFFNSVLKRLNKPEMENKSLCTNLMTKYLIPNLLNSNLNYMSKIFNIRHSKAHRALDDAKATAQLLLNYLKIFIDKDIQKPNHLYYPRNRYELDRIHYKSGQHSLEEIEKKLKKLKTPSLVTLKGENGVILYSLPCMQKEKEHEFILEKLKESEWKTATIKLFGPYLEALVHFNNLFSKMEPAARGETIRLMWELHLPGIPLPPKGQEHLIPEVNIDKDFGDFVITHHLVPEQMIIFPLQSLHVKNQLIFRYPSHKKKLLQYINSKSQRLGNNKIKKTHFHPLLKSFIDHYLERLKAEDNKIFVIKKKKPLTRPEEFFSELDDFLSENPNSYQYPSEYI
ncbi:MAG: 3'-5' exonuclease [Halobacteriovoraceae bacterium]|nr:3'-5' exonuclease [Halobacteriovoraceae bacterium]